MLFWLVKFLQFESLQFFSSILIAVTCLNTTTIEAESRSEPSQTSKMLSFCILRK